MNVTATSALNLPPAERHICLFVRESGQFNLALWPLLAALSGTSATVILILDQVDSRLPELLADPLVQRMVAAGRLHPMEAASFYLSEQTFDPAAVFKRLAHLSFDVAKTGQPLVVIGGISWAIRQQPGFDLAQYEAGLDKLLVEQPALSMLVCIYEANYCNGETALAALQTHPVGH
ncbi:MAG: MEDS domain-containing protein [Anaerolineae bacterium]